MKNWRVPAVILVLLILAITFRWNVDKNTSGDGSSTVVSKYNTDRWNGSVTHEVLTNIRVNSFIIQKPAIGGALASSEGLTVIWKMLTGISLIWLLIALPKKKNVNNIVSDKITVTTEG